MCFSFVWSWCSFVSVCVFELYLVDWWDFLVDCFVVFVLK